MYDWLNLVQAVSETTLLNFNEVFEMPITDFLAYLTYINDKRNRERAELMRAKGSIKLI